MISSEKVCKEFSLKLRGSELKIDSITTLDQPKKNSIFFIKKQSEKSKKLLAEHKKSFVLLPENYDTKSLENSDLCYAVCENPRNTFFEIAEKYFYEKNLPRIHETANIDTQAEIGANTNIENNVQIIGKCFIGNNVKIGANSLIIGPCFIEDDCTFSSGVIIGEESLSIRKENNVNFQNPQMGGIKIGKGCRVGVFSTISRGSIGDTILEDNVFMGEYSHVGHNSYIASKSVLTIRSSICGSVRVLDESWFGPHSLVLNGVTISSKIKLGSGSVLQNNAKREGTYFGNPAKLLNFK